MMTPQEIAERRNCERFPIMKKAAMVFGAECERFPIMKKAAMVFGAEIVEATIFDVSASGAKVRLDCADLPATAIVGQMAELKIPETGDFQGQIVWTDDEYLGLSFFDDYSLELNAFLS
ncbi:MAG: PilZ domain-containing protein [Rhodospirillales bacterium]|nr:PilZ domain-containing protein [Rhodospirillales bacterium]